MDASTSEVFAPLPELTETGNISGTPPKQTYERRKRVCNDNPSSQEQFPLASNPSVLLHVLTEYGLDAKSLTRLEATCTFFRRPAQLLPDIELSLTEVAALDMCYKRAIFKTMGIREREYLKQRCGGSWKLVLRFLLTGEACSRREKSFAVAGPGHSIVVMQNGDVYSFGSNSYGQLGNGTTENVTHPCKIRSLQGIRIIQATAGWGKTILISDVGRVYKFGKRIPREKDASEVKCDLTPQLVESLKDIFVVQAVIETFYTAFLSREGTVYTFSCAKDSKLGHVGDLYDLEPRPLLGALENVPVVQIAAGHCVLLALACQPSGMSVYSVSCEWGGTLGHGTKDNENHPRLIEEFRTLNIQPKMIAAGRWHSAVIGEDGRVCTWGCGWYGCLGHGDEGSQYSPKVVKALANVKAVHIATGGNMTFVVTEDGDIYSFGLDFFDNLGLPQPVKILSPVLVTSLKKIKERIVYFSVANSIHQWVAHKFALAESGKLYAFGYGREGQLGVQLADAFPYRDDPELVNIDLS